MTTGFLFTDFSGKDWQDMEHIAVFHSSGIKTSLSEQDSLQTLMIFVPTMTGQSKLISVSWTTNTGTSMLRSDKNGITILYSTVQQITFTVN